MRIMGLQVSAVVSKLMGAGLASAVAVFNDSQLADQDRARRAGRHQLSDITLEARLRILANRAGAATGADETGRRAGVRHRAERSSRTVERAAEGHRSGGAGGVRAGHEGGIDPAGKAHQDRPAGIQRHVARGRLFTSPVSLPSAPR